jgi:hypothetical protein
MRISLQGGMFLNKFLEQSINMGIYQKLMDFLNHLYQIKWGTLYVVSCIKERVTIDEQKFPKY